MKDDAIVQLLWDRDEAALAQAKQEYEPYCLYVAQNLLRDGQDAKECLNDMWLAVWKSIPPHRPACLKTYLGKLTREIAIDRLRKQSAQKRISSEVMTSLDELEEIIGDNGTETLVEQAELSHRISAFLRSLREDERNCFIRRYWYCDPVKSICARYGYGQSKVLVTLKRTRDKLARYLKKEGYLL